MSIRNNQTPPKLTNCLSLISHHSNSIFNISSYKLNEPGRSQLRLLLSAFSFVTLISPDNWFDELFSLFASFNGANKRPDEMERSLSHEIFWEKTFRKETSREKRDIFQAVKSAFSQVKLLVNCFMVVALQLWRWSFLFLSSNSSGDLGMEVKLRCS